MSITKVTDPASVPAAVVDYQGQNIHTDRLLGNVTQPFPIDGTNIKKGSLFNIGGDMFYTDADTAITGTPSDYVKLTVTGTDAAPSFVASLTGVTWNDAYNGYYNVGGDLHVFDEVLAILNGELSSGNTRLSELVDNNFIKLKTKVIDIGVWDMVATGNVDVSHGLTLIKIRTIKGIIINDPLANIYTFGTVGGVTNPVPLDLNIFDTTSTVVRLYRRSGGAFDNTLFDDTGINRGWLTIEYED